MISTLVRADRLRLAHLFVSKEETRYYLNGALIEPLAEGARIVATDGHRMAVFLDKEGRTDKACIAQLPKPALAAAKKIKNRALGWFGIVGENRGWGRHEGRIVAIPEAMIGDYSEIERAMLDVSNELVVWAGGVDLIDGRFPEWRDVLPRSAPREALAAACDPKRLKEFLAVAADDDCGRVMRLLSGRILGGASGAIQQSPTIVDAGREDFVGVIMPSRYEDFADGIRVGFDKVEPPRWTSEIATDATHERAPKPSPDAAPIAPAPAEAEPQELAA